MKSSFLVRRGHIQTTLFNLYYFPYFNRGAVERKITKRTLSPGGLVRSNRTVGSYGLSIKGNNTTVNQAACTFYQHSLWTLSRKTTEKMLRKISRDIKL